VTVESAAFAATLIGAVAGIFASARGYGRSAFWVVSALFFLSSWVILGSYNGIPGTDGPATMWGVMLMAYLFGLVLMFALRKRTDAIR
jgi:hypothetical protein